MTLEQKNIIIIMFILFIIALSLDIYYESIAKKNRETLIEIQKSVEGKRDV